MEETEIIYRKMNSEDIIRMRSHSIKIDLVDGKETTIGDFGKTQQALIILSVAKCPWFTDVINEETGITDLIWSNRMKQFKKIPVDKLDVLFKEATEYGKIKIDVQVMQKNL